jgi:hypothetical protein
MLPRIFIGGTGRSGTTLLYHVLGRHRAIHSLTNEMRFIIDPDGLMKLVDALTVDFSPVQAREALFRFERLMHVDLNQPNCAPFLGYDIADWLGGSYYWQRLEDFIGDLIEVEYAVPRKKQPDPYSGSRIAPVGVLFERFSQRLLKQAKPPNRATFNWPRSREKVVKYFPERSKLLELAVSFVDDLFLRVARQAGKQTWCEKTPQNIFHVSFLWELFPDSIVIHVKRDPRGVALSTLHQAWGPNSLEDVCVFLRTMYERWLSIAATLDKGNDKYLEVKLEDLVTSPHAVLGEIVSRAGLDYDFDQLPDINPARIGYWPSELTGEELQRVNRMLGPYIERMGYEV